MEIHKIKAIYYDNVHNHTILIGKNEIILKEKPLDVIEALCNRYGMSMQGSIYAIKRTLNIHQKCPILVHPILQIYLFPTVSMYDKQCMWINPKQIKRCISQELNSVIYFNDGTYLNCVVGIRSLKKQIKRCNMMEAYILKQYQIDHLTLKL